MADDFSQRCGELLTGSYDCVDRVVLNAHYPLGHSPGGSGCGGGAGTVIQMPSWMTRT